MAPLVRVRDGSLVTGWMCGRGRGHGRVGDEFFHFGREPFRYVTPSVQGNPFVFPYLRLALPAIVLASLVGCGPDYSPDTYSTAAVQQANKVDQGVIAGYREVAIRSDGTVGAVTGGAAGGVLGAQEPDGGVVTALSAIGGTLVGGLVGASVERAAGDTTAFEYLVRKKNGDLISVTQKDQSPLAVGLKVLVIEGKQARVVPDYSVPVDEPAPSDADAAGKSKTKVETKSAKSSPIEGADKTVTAPDKAANGVAITTAPLPAAPTAGQAAPPAAAAASPAAASAPPSQPAALPASAPQATATSAPAATTPTPAPAAASSSTPANAAATNAPQSQPAAPQGPAPEAAAAPAPQPTSAPVAEPPPAPADQSGAAPAAASTPLAPSGGSNPPQ